MMAHIEHFRVVRAARPAFADQIMAAWGREEFPSLVGNMIRTLGVAGAAQPSLLLSLESLKAAHDHEFPALAEKQDEPNAEALASAHFQVINQRFAHIGKKLAGFWGKPEFSAYVNGLMNDTRDGERKGFPPDIMIALWHIIDEHDQKHPACRLKTTDIWSLNDSA